MQHGPGASGQRAQHPHLKHHGNLLGGSAQVAKPADRGSSGHDHRGEPLAWDQPIRPGPDNARPSDTSRPATPQEFAAVRQAMRHVVSGPRLLAAFARADPARQGHLCPRDFVQALRGLGVPPRHVFSSVHGPAVADLSQDSIDYVAFVKALEPCVQHAGPVAEGPPRSAGRRRPEDAPSSGSSPHAAGLANRDLMPCSRKTNLRPNTADGTEHADPAAGLDGERIGAQASPAQRRASLPCARCPRPLALLLRGRCSREQGSLSAPGTVRRRRCVRLLTRWCLEAARLTRAPPTPGLPCLMAQQAIGPCRATSR